MRREPFCVVLFSLLTLLLLLTSPPRLSAAPLTIGLLPEMNVFQQMKRYQPLAEYIEKQLGAPVRLQMVSRYGNITENIKKKRVDAIFIGSFTGALCITQLNLHPIARPLWLDGTSTYYGKIFTRKDTGIKTVADMRGKRLALVERATTAGYVFPLAYFRNHGVKSLDEYFAAYFFTGSHDAAITAVLEGDAEVGAAKNTIFDKVLAENPQARQKLVVLANSPMVPSNGLCLRPELVPKYAAKLSSILLTMHQNTEGAAVLDRFGALRFIPTSKADYQVVMDIARQAGIDLAQYRYKNR